MTALTGLSGVALVAATISATAFATPAAAQQAVTGTVTPSIWIDPDGCQHWAADGGVEGYMEGRVDPVTGMPVCMEVNTCAVMNSDVLFATDSSALSSQGRAMLEQFFGSAGAFAYAIYGHTDSRASDEYNIALSERRVASVAQVAASVGAPVARAIGFGERRPIAPNDTPANLQRNRRVEIICYR